MDEPYRFSFFQAVRLFEKIYPNRKPVGDDAMPEQEVVRFRSYISLDFPASEIYEIQKVFDELTETERIEMTICMMGMVGVSGVLPTHYTELVLDRIRHRDTALWAFLDIFTHRAASLFYRAWAKYRFPVGYERGDDEFTHYLFDFAGLGTKGQQGKLAFEDEALLPYVGHIAQKPHSAVALANTISDYFSVPVAVNQFSGQWLDLEPSDRSYMGKQNYQLGRNTIAGTRIWDQQSKFSLRIGPMNFDKFRAFLPDSKGFAELKSLVTFLVGLELDWDFRLVLERKSVPGTVLTTRAKRRPQLGWTSFLKSKPFNKDDDQVRISP
ncbi:MAG TPA: type VI secretion system baseplate subunit TssG [Pyrinomonadaceae bacterium]|nr:type VI secretion system baseplate subunit TssG [Pyrinomonadaceae bacterium]